jgi:hypothetical protein
MYLAVITWKTISSGSEDNSGLNGLRFGVVFKSITLDNIMSLTLLEQDRSKGLGRCSLTRGSRGEGDGLNFVRHPCMSCYESHLWDSFF